MNNYKPMMDEIKASDALKKRVILNLNNSGKEKKKSVPFKTAMVSCAMLIILACCILCLDPLTNNITIHNPSGDDNVYSSPATFPSCSTPTVPHTQMTRQPVSYETAKKETGWPIHSGSQQNFVQYILLFRPFSSLPELEYEYTNGYIRICRSLLEMENYESYQNLFYQDKEFWIDSHQEGTISIIYQSDMLSYSAIFYNINQSEALNILNEIIM